MPPPPSAGPAPAPAPAPSKSVSFCEDCRRASSSSTSQQDLRYYSDPGRPPAAPDPDRKYYSEPDDNDYFEIDYVFLKQLREIARKNCPKCRRKRTRKTDSGKGRGEGGSKETYVYCNGRYHSDKEHCRLCCRVCNRSPDAAAATARPRASRERNDSIQSNKSASNKSVSFLESSNDETLKDETNYTAKSFTNDLKKFLLKPTPPRLSLRDKFIFSFKQELEATKRSPKLKAIKGFWKSY